MITYIDKCPSCKKTRQLIKSNNPLVTGMCEECLQEQIDIDNLKQADYFCRTYNIPFVPDKWLKILQAGDRTAFLHDYVNVITQERSDTLYYGTSTGDLWGEANKEWERIKTHEQLIRAIEPIKQGFMDQMAIKWGPRFRFEEYIELENIYNSTIRMGGIVNPLTMNVIKKIAIVSVDMNRALDDQDVKAAGVYGKMHTDLIKAAGLEDMVEVGETDTISTVSDLCQYLEDNGFQFRYYDDVPRDVVDKTIEDQQEWIRNFVTGATGIQQTYELIEDTYKSKLEKEKTEKAIAEVSLEDLIKERRDGLNEGFDKELEEEDFVLEDEDYEE